LVDVEGMNLFSPVNLSLEEIKKIININNINANSKYDSPFTMMLWNINTINDRKLKRIKELVNILEDNELIRANKSTHTKAKISNEIDLIIIVEMGKKYSNFNPYNLNGFKLLSQLRIDRKGGSK